jgi:hypothetical protein
MLYTVCGAQGARGRLDKAYGPVGARFVGYASDGQTQWRLSRIGELGSQDETTIAHRRTSPI